MSVIPATIKPRAKPHLFAHTYWDMVPVGLALAHFAFQLALFALFPVLSWWVLLPLGLCYSYAISWNIESVAHNFTHNEYFKSRILNRAFSLLESITIGFSQQFYKTVHISHHKGNSDRPDENGKTKDWFSIYRNGKNGQPESVVSYSLFGMFKVDEAEVYAAMGKNGREKDVHWAHFENFAHMAWFAILGVWHPAFILYFLPFYYLGHVFSMMVGYYEHYMANPDLPIAWGVSTYNRLYNFFWMNNGYHAEHHYRPKMHWTKMRNLRDEIHKEQQDSNVHVIKYSHLFGFLQRSPEKKVA